MMGRSKLEIFVNESSYQAKVPKGQATIARSFNCGLAVAFDSSPEGTAENLQAKFLSPLRGLAGFESRIPPLKRRAIFGSACGAKN
jgi:hypothetical protein